MSNSNIQWRKLLLELTVIFFGVTLAFFVENYREKSNEREELKQVLSGIIFELNYLAERGSIHQSAIETSIAEWQVSYESGVMAIPGFYRLPGSPTPPSSAWQSAVATGTVSDIPADLRLEIGYFYEEFIGVHSNYLRYTEITERDLMPMALKGAKFFYDSNGELAPNYKVHMQLQLEYASDLKQLTQTARELVVTLNEFHEQF